MAHGPLGHYTFGARNRRDFLNLVNFKADIAKIIIICE